MIKRYEINAVFAPQLKNEFRDNAKGLLHIFQIYSGNLLITKNCNTAMSSWEWPSTDQGNSSGPISFGSKFIFEKLLYRWVEYTKIWKRKQKIIHILLNQNCICSYLNCNFHSLVEHVCVCAYTITIIHLPILYLR